MRGSIVCLVLLFGTAGAEADRELRSIIREQRAPLSITIVAPRAETARPPRAIDPAVSAAVFARLGSPQAEEVPRAADPAPVVEQFDGFRIATKPEKKPWRPRVMPLPLSFPTGGGGVKLKIRW